MIAINIEPVNFNASQELINHVKEMFQNMDKYNDMAVNADLYLKSHPEKSTDNKEVSIRMNMPGQDIYISKDNSDFISAAQDLQEALKVALSKHKDMHKDRHEPVPGKV